MDGRRSFSFGNPRKARRLPGQEAYWSTPNAPITHPGCRLWLVDWSRVVGLGGGFFVWEGRGGGGEEKRGACGDFFLQRGARQLRGDGDGGAREERRRGEALSPLRPRACASPALARAGERAAPGRGRAHSPWPVGCREGESGEREGGGRRRGGVSETERERELESKTRGAPLRPAPLCALSVRPPARQTHRCGR